MNWREDFERRCRRILGVTDDSQPVDVEMDTTYYSTMTGSENFVVLRVGTKVREFLYMGDLIKELDAVPDD